MKGVTLFQKLAKLRIYVGKKLTKNWIQASWGYLGRQKYPGITQTGGLGDQGSPGVMNLRF